MSIPALIMQTSYKPELVRQNLKNTDQTETSRWNITFNVNKETHPRPLFQELNALTIYQIILLQIPIFMERVKILTSPRVFSTYFQPIFFV